MRRDTSSAVVDSFVIDPNRSSYTDYTGEPGVTYMYSVSAFDSLNGILGYSAPGEDIGRRVLVAPTGVNVDAGSSETVAEVTWRDNSGAEDGYRIYRREDAGTLTEVGSTGPNETTFNDFSAPPGDAYEYCVRAFNSAMSAGGSRLGESYETCDTGWLPANGVIAGRIANRLDLGGLLLDLLDDVLDHLVVRQLVALLAGQIDHARSGAAAGKAHIRH